MRSHCHASSQRLLDGRSHGAFIAGMAAAGDVGRRDRPHQRFLRAVGDGLGELPHVAIQINAVHSLTMIFNVCHLRMTTRGRLRSDRWVLACEAYAAVCA